MNKYAVSNTVVFRNHNSQIITQTRLEVIECYPDMIVISAKNLALSYADTFSHIALYGLIAIYVNVNDTEDRALITVI